jgi:ribosomal protein L17
VYKDRIKEVEKIVERIVPLMKQTIVEVERRVEVPIIHEKQVIVPQII